MCIENSYVCRSRILLHCLSYVLLCSNCFLLDRQEDPQPQYNYLDHDHGDALFKLGVGGATDDQSSPSHSMTRRLQGSSYSFSSVAVKSVNVDHFGARGDGRTDDTRAFRKAWKEACSSRGAVLAVSPKSYLVKPVTFSGPCEDDIRVEIYGTVVAPDDRSEFSKDRRHWIVFNAVENLVVEGGGTIDGNGKIWWQHSCKVNKSLPCTRAPTAVTFNNCKNLIVRDLRIRNAQQMHISFDRCYNVLAAGLIVTAPRNSPNTDGIHVTGTRNIEISHCRIGMGDDCISIVSGSRRVLATDITCGPGHGISIGSLGAGNSEAHVSGVTVDRAKLSGTANGVRIKTWQGGSGSARNMIFQNIEMQNVSNPIIVDQYYCDQPEPCKQQSSAVQVRGVIYQNIMGTSASDVALKFNCSNSRPCRGILLQNISLERAGGGAAIASCSNVKYANIGCVSPSCN